MANVLMIPIYKEAIRRVHKTVGEAGGHVTWNFSQLLPPVSSLIAQNKVSADGICEFLSAQWIERHAHDDHLANWLATEGSPGSIDASKIRLLMQLFIAGNTMPAGDMIEFEFLRQQDQTTATMLYLAAKGVVPRAAVSPAVTQVDGNFIHQGGRGGGMRRVMARTLATQIVGQRNSAGSYRAIGVWGPKDAHAMAAWVAEDVAFFDPNFGEFWFERPETFVNWFPKFWHTSLYGNPLIGLSDRYELIDYAKAV